MANINDIEFLKDQVNRLNSQLTKYHEIFSQRNEGSNKAHVNMILNSFTSPLLNEYDKVIYELQDEIKSYKLLMEESNRKFKTMTNENERLWSQISNKTSGNSNSASHDELRVNLEKQIDNLKKENRSLQETLKVSDQEIARLQNGIEAFQSTPEAVMFNEQLEALKRQHNITVTELEHELVNLKDRNRESNYEMEKLQMEYLEVDKEHKMLQEKAKFEKATNEENLSQLKLSLKRMEFLEEEKNQLQEQIEVMKEQLKNNSVGTGEWSKVLKGLEGRCKEKDSQILELNDKIMEQQKQVEAVIFEKKEVEVREIQALTESERLRNVIAEVINDAGVRTREECEMLRGNYEKEVSRIVEELSYCEQNRQELLAEIDQIKRSKSQLETELEQIHRSERERDIKEMSSTEIYQDRCIRAERERETYKLELEQLKMSLEKHNEESRNREENLEIEVGSLRTKLALLQSSNDKSSLELERYSQLLQSSQEGHSETQTRLKSSLKACQHEYELYKQASASKQRELETRLGELDKTHRHTQDEMRLILTKQQQLNNKWRSETHSITDQYEEKLTGLTKEIDRFKKRNEEMTQLLYESKQKILESNEKIDDQSKVIENLENRVLISKDPNFEKDQNEDDSNWKLVQLKKQQQKIIRDSVARKYNFI